MSQRVQAFDFLLGAVLKGTPAGQINLLTRDPCGERSTDVGRAGPSPNEGKIIDGAESFSTVSVPHVPASSSEICPLSEPTSKSPSQSHTTAMSVI